MPEKVTAAPEDRRFRPGRRCPHGVEVGPLDDYGLPYEQEASDYSVYCWECNREDGPTPKFPEPAVAAEVARWDLTPLLGFAFVVVFWAGVGVACWTWLS